MRKSVSYVADLIARKQAFEVKGRGVQLFAPKEREELDGDAGLRSDNRRGDLKKSDAELNAEFTYPHDPRFSYHRRAVRLAHQKVVAWPHHHDRRAVTISAGRAFIPSEKDAKRRASERLRENAQLRREEKAAATQSLLRAMQA